MVLASEPLCLCGCDVAAPNQVRRCREEPLADMLRSFRAQLTDREVRRRRRRGSQPSLPCSSLPHSASFPSTACQLTAPPPLLHALQWQSIMRHSPDERAMEDQFRKLWSLKEVSWMGRAGVCVCVRHGGPVPQALEPQGSVNWVGRAGVRECGCAMEDQFRKLWSLSEMSTAGLVVVVVVVMRVGGVGGLAAHVSPPRCNRPPPRNSPALPQRTHTPPPCPAAGVRQGGGPGSGL